MGADSLRFYQARKVRYSIKRRKNHETFFIYYLDRIHVADGVWSYSGLGPNCHPYACAHKYEYT
jgi:hypothetical protein